MTGLRLLWFYRRKNNIVSFQFRFLMYHNSEYFYGGETMHIYRAGIDIGSTTIKLVVLGDKDQILYGQYMRHGAHIQETLTKLLQEA